jgi:hypothetical protein
MLCNMLVLSQCQSEAWSMTRQTKSSSTTSPLMLHMRCFLYSSALQER